MASIVDSYIESNRDDDISVGPEPDFSDTAYQSFTGDGKALYSVKLYLSKTGTPTGNAHVDIYAHSGTFGTSSVPTGSVLATSSNFDVSTLTGTPTLYEILFTGANKITLTNATKYVWAFVSNNGNASNFVNIGIDITSPTHGGNWGDHFGGTWNAVAGGDLIFYVYGEAVGPTATASWLRA